MKFFIKLQVFNLILFLIIVNLFAGISVSPSGYILYNNSDLHKNNNDIYINFLELKDENFDFSGINVSLRKKYDYLINDYSIDKWFFLEKNNYLFDDKGKIKLQYTLKTPLKLKKELALELVLEFVPKKESMFRQIYNTTLYILPDIKKKKIDIENVTLKDDKIIFTIKNCCNFHIRPFFGLFSKVKVDKRKIIGNTYISEPIFPEKSKKITMIYNNNNFKIDFSKSYLLRIEDKSKNLDILKVIKIKGNK